MRNFTILTALASAPPAEPAPKTEISTNGVESGAVSAVPAGLSAEDEAAIRAVDVEWSRAATAGDAGALTAVYASDATLLPPGEPVAKGEAMKKYNADMIDAFSGPIELTTTAGRAGVTWHTRLACIARP